ncbi:MAG: hypothetical protein U0W65_00805 [Bacteroidia bacterium]|jgi:hypothetical protein|nr:hypothetical protein [Bacteroidia bacterium]
MTCEIKDPLSIASVYLWVGFVCAISFMESWLKFKAPGVDIPTGLGIGRLVFSTLNKVEWFFAVAIVFSMFISKSNLFMLQNLAFFIPILALVLQTLWLLPVLDDRAQMLIRGETVAPSNIHFYYIVLEILKVGSLIIFSVKLFRD